MRGMLGGGWRTVKERPCRRGAVRLVLKGDWHCFSSSLSVESPALKSRFTASLCRQGQARAREAGSLAARPATNYYYQAPGEQDYGESNMYAVSVTGGKQYKVAEGEYLRVEKLEAETGST